MAQFLRNVINAWFKKLDVSRNLMLGPSTVVPLCCGPILVVPGIGHGRVLRAVRRPTRGIPRALLIVRVTPMAATTVAVLMAVVVVLAVMVRIAGCILQLYAMV